MTSRQLSRGPLERRQVRHPKIFSLRSPVARVVYRCHGFTALNVTIARGNDALESLDRSVGLRPVTVTV